MMIVAGTFIETCIARANHGFMFVTEVVRVAPCNVAPAVWFGVGVQCAGRSNGRSFFSPLLRRSGGFVRPAELSRLPAPRAGAVL